MQQRVRSRRVLGPDFSLFSHNSFRSCYGRVLVESNLPRRSPKVGVEFVRETLDEADAKQVLGGNADALLGRAK